MKNEELKYYIMLDESGKHISPGYREDTEVPEDVKSKGFLATKAEFGKLFNGYLRNPITGEFEEIPPYEPTLDELKTAKLADIDRWTAAKIIGGFTSSCSGKPVQYDSDEDTQSTMQTMYAATKSLDFTTRPDYQGVIPVRGYADGSAIKTVFYLTAPQVQKFMDDLALHIGKCKQAGWEKQALVEAASTVEELEQIVL